MKKVVLIAATFEILLDKYILYRLIQQRPLDHFVHGSHGSYRFKTSYKLTF